jgi:hypothetical protein
MNQKRRLFSLMVGCLAALIVGSFLLFQWQPHPVSADSSWDSMTTILDDPASTSTRQTAAEQDAMIRHAATCERAIIFVHADWSLTSALGLRDYDDYSAAYLQQPDRPFVDFHYMDYSVLNEAPQRLTDLPGWQELRAPRNSALLYGNGELIYLEKGQVIAVEPVLLNGPTNGPTRAARIRQAVDWTNRLVQMGANH